MGEKNPDSPWNPAVSVAVTPEEFERQVVEWLRAARGELREFHVTHRRRLGGAGGGYEFDAVVQFEVLEGALVTILVECKRHSAPVKREVVLALDAKLRDTGAQKAMVFSTAGFQRGALEYATSRGIATVTFIEGTWTYETRGRSGPSKPPPWANFPRFAGLFVAADEKSIRSITLKAGHIDALDGWLSRDVAG